MRILVALTALLLAASAHAQTVTNARVVTACGTPPGTYANGETRPILQNTDGEVCTVGGAGGGGGAATIADGADATQGAIADAAATAGSTGTVSAKLRFLTSINNTISTTLTAISGFVDGLETNTADLDANTDEIEGHLSTLAGTVDDGTVLSKIVNENGDPISWAPLQVGNAISSVSVSTSTAVFTAGSNDDAREIIFTPLETNTAAVYCVMFAGAATTTAYTFRLDPTDDPYSGGRDGYVGETRCVAATGTQTVLVSVLE